MQNSDKTSHNGTLTPGQVKAINSLLYSTNIKQASELSGISRRTIHRWLSDEVFKGELQRARQRVRDDSIENLKILFGHAVDTLSEILLNSQDERTKLRACELILNYNYNFIELSELDARLRQLEGRANEANS